MEPKTSIWIGKNGLTNEVLQEIKVQLKKKGLIKIKFLKYVRPKMDEMVEKILKETGAKILKWIGGIIIIEGERHGKSTGSKSTRSDKGTGRRVKKNKGN